MQGTIFFSFLLFAINKAYFLLNPRNIISNIIIIFNINSTRGHTGSLLVNQMLIQILQSGGQETESRFRSDGYYGTEFRSCRVTTEDKQVQPPPLKKLHRMQCISATSWWQLVISYIYPPDGIIFTASVTQATCGFVER